MEEKTTTNIMITPEQKDLLEKILEIYKNLKSGGLVELDFMFWNKINDNNIAEYRGVRKKLTDILFPTGTTTTLFKEFLEVEELLELVRGLN